MEILSRKEEQGKSGDNKKQRVLVMEAIRFWFTNFCSTDL